MCRHLDPRAPRSRASLAGDEDAWPASLQRSARMEPCSRPREACLPGYRRPGIHTYTHIQPLNDHGNPPTPDGQYGGHRNAASACPGFQRGGRADTWPGPSLACRSVCVLRSWRSDWHRRHPIMPHLLVFLLVVLSLLKPLNRACRDEVLVESRDNLRRAQVFLAHLVDSKPGGGVCPQGDRGCSVRAGAADGDVNNGTGVAS